MRWFHRVIFFLLLLVLMLGLCAPRGCGFEMSGALLCLVGVASALWVFGLSVGREAHLVSSVLSAPLLLLATYGVMRYGLTEVESVARREVVTLLGLMWMTFLIMNSIRHRWQLTWLVWVLVAAGCGVALEAIWQFLRNGSAAVWPGMGGPTGKEPVRGVFAGSADLVVYLHLIFPVAAANFLFSRRKLTAKILCGLACALLMVGMAVSGEWRYWMGWLASVTVLIVCLLRKRGWKFRWAMVGGAVLLIVVAAAWVAISRLEVFAPAESQVHSLVATHPATPSKPMSAPEIPLWRSAASMTLQHPWIGVGPGMFRWYYPGVRGMQMTPTTAGNEYLTFMAEYGFIGVALMTWMALALVVTTVFILRSRVRRYSGTITSNRYAFAVAGLAVAATATVDAWLGCGFHASVNQLTFAALMATTLTCGLHNQTEDKLHQYGRYTVLQLRGVNRWLLIIGGVVMLGLFWWQLYRTYPSEFFIWRAHRAAAQGEWTTVRNLYQKARHADHRSFEATVGLGDACVAQALTKPDERTSLYLDAVRWYEEVLNRYNPRAHEVRLKLAQAYDAVGNRDRARDSLKQVVQSDPRNAAYHRALAEHYQHWGDLDLATESFHRADALSPSASKHTAPPPPNTSPPTSSSDTEAP